jgi:hypothetical protein
MQKWKPLAHENLQKPPTVVEKPARLKTAFGQTVFST